MMTLSEAKEALYNEECVYRVLERGGVYKIISGDIKYIEISRSCITANIDHETNIDIEYLYKTKSDAKIAALSILEFNMIRSIELAKANHNKNVEMLTE